MLTALACRRKILEKSEARGGGGKSGITPPAWHGSPPTKAPGGGRGGSSENNAAAPAPRAKNPTVTGLGSCGGGRARLRLNFGVRSSEFGAVQPYQ